MAYKKLERVDRQMKLYGLNKLQRGVIIDLFFEYIDAVFAEASVQTADQLFVEIFGTEVQQIKKEKMN